MFKNLQINIAFVEGISQMSNYVKSFEGDLDQQEEIGRL